MPTPETAMCRFANFFVLFTILLILGACSSGGSDGGDNKGHGNPDNTAPVANAGPDVSVEIGVTVTLNGSGTDAEGDTLTFTWNIDSAPAGSNAALSNSVVSNPTITPDVAGSYILSLVTSDGNLNSAADTMQIDVVTGNTAPIANAGLDQSTLVGETVQLDGSLSSDPDGSPTSPLTYSWVIKAAPVSSTASLTGASTPTPSLTPDLAGDYTVELTVSDGEDVHTDTVVVTAGGGSVHSLPMGAPVVIPDNDTATGLTSNIDVTGGPNPVTNVFVTLDITHPNLNDLDIYLRSPTMTLIELTTDNGGNGSHFSGTIFSDFATQSVVDGAAPFAGTYSPEQALSALNGIDANGTWSLIIYDDAGGDTGTLNSWSLTFLDNAPPVADAGTDTRTPIGYLALLDGSGSHDANADPLTFSWSLVAKPDGSSAMVSDPAAAVTNIRPDLAGVYQLQLTVNDGSETSQVVEKVVVAYPAPPTGSAYVATDVPVAIIPQIADPSSSVTVTGGPAVIGAVEVHVDIEHTYLEDVTVELESPSGTIVELTSKNGGDTDYYTDTVFTDAATTPITAGTTPYTGSYYPEELLGKFSGESSTGVWTLHLIDDFPASDNGALWGWDIKFIAEGTPLPSSPPVANAGPNQTLPGAGAVALNGGASSDPDGNTLTYWWTLYQTPEGSKAALTDRNAKTNPGFIADADGVYRFMLTVDDGLYQSTDNVAIAVGTLTPGGSSTDDPVAIPDKNPTGADLSIELSNAPVTITSVIVQDVNIAHNAVSSLILTLTSPSGTTILLSEQNGQSGANYTGTNFDDAVGIFIWSGTAPFTGTYRPEQALSTFAGEDANGIWTLNVEDVVTGTTGTFESWSIVVN